MNIDAGNLAYQWEEAHRKWVTLHEAAEIADLKSRQVEAQLFSFYEEGSAEARKQAVRNDARWNQAQMEAIKARSAASFALGERQRIEKQIDLFRTLESTKRAEMNLR